MSDSTHWAQLLVDRIVTEKKGYPVKDWILDLVDQTSGDIRQALRLALFELHLMLGAEDNTLDLRCLPSERTVYRWKEST